MTMVRKMEKTTKKWIRKGRRTGRDETRQERNGQGRAMEERQELVIPELLG
jgi:transposase